MNPLLGLGYAARLGLLISFTPTLAGIWFAIRPSERQLSYMRPLTLAGIFAAFCTGAFRSYERRPRAEPSPRVRHTDASGQHLGSIRGFSRVMRFSDCGVDLRGHWNAATRVFVAVF